MAQLVVERSVSPNSNRLPIRRLGCILVPSEFASGVGMPRHQTHISPSPGPAFEIETSCRRTGHLSSKYDEHARPPLQGVSPGKMSSDHAARLAKAPEDEVLVLWERERGGDLVFCPEAWHSYPPPRVIHKLSPREAWDPKVPFLGCTSEVREVCGAHLAPAHVRTGLVPQCFFSSSFELFKLLCPLEWGHAGPSRLESSMFVQCVHYFNTNARKAYSLLRSCYRGKLFPPR